MKAIKTLKELFEMADNNAESTLIYGYSTAGSVMWDRLTVLKKLVEDAENAIIDYEESKDEPAPQPMYDVFDSLDAAHRALYEKYVSNADDFVKALIAKRVFDTQHESTKALYEKYAHEESEGTT